MIIINIFKKKQQLLLFVFCISLNSLFSETVILIHEEVIRGKVNSQDAISLKMTDEKGKERVFPKTEILKVIYRDVTDKAELDKIIKEEKEKKGIKTTKFEKRDKKQIIWRSALLPGWGQWKAGKKKYTYITVGAFLLAGAYVSGRRSAAISEQASYDQTSLGIGILTFNNIQNSSGQAQNQILLNVLINQSLFTPVETSIANYNNSLAIFGIIYLAQLTHSYYIGKAWEKEAQTTMLPSGKVLNLGWNFDIKQKMSENQIGSKENVFDLNYVHSF